MERNKPDTKIEVKNKKVTFKVKKGKKKKRKNRVTGKIIDLKTGNVIFKPDTKKCPTFTALCRELRASGYVPTNIVINKDDTYFCRKNK
jgi:hypothetical protein